MFYIQYIPTLCFDHSYFSTCLNQVQLSTVLHKVYMWPPTKIICSVDTTFTKTRKCSRKKTEDKRIGCLLMKCREGRTMCDFITYNSLGN